VIPHQLRVRQAGPSCAGVVRKASLADSTRRLQVMRKTSDIGQQRRRCREGPLRLDAEPLRPCCATKSGGKPELVTAGRF